MRRAFQWDLARQVERLDVLLDLLPRYAAWGYQELYLHLEDAVDYPSLPGVARAGAYSSKDLQKLVRAAGACGIGVVPIINLLGHTQYLIKTAEWRDLNERRAPDGSPLETGQLCPLHPRTPDLIERLFRDAVPWCTAGKIHVGLDESFHLAQCPRCRAEAAEHGVAKHFAHYVDRLQQAARARSLQLGLWADMVALYPEALPLLPPGVALYDWYYYSFERLPRLELHNFREYDLASACRDRALQWWACPMSGAFRHEPLPIFGDRLENIRSWWHRGREAGATGLLVTSWEAYRLTLTASTLVDAAAASLWLDEDGATAPVEDLLARGLARLRGGRVRDTDRAGAARLIAGDAYPFSGYFEWEASARWDGGATATPPAELRRVIEQLPPAGHDLPPELEASLSLRRYLARRALFIREAADAVAQLRQELAHERPWLRQSALLSQAQVSAGAFAEELEQAVQDAERMWTASREKSWPSQNSDLLAGDARRLREWVEWLQRVVSEPAQAREASPVFGRWRLQFEVHNFAPAVQKVCVEVQEPGKATWRELASRHTIEFRSAAAQPQADVRRAFSVAIEGPRQRHRLVLRGCGQVRISKLYWTDGVTALGVSGDRDFVLGLPAPTHGLPDLNAITDVHVIEPLG